MNMISFATTPRRQAQFEQIVKNQNAMFGGTSKYKAHKTKVFVVKAFDFGLAQTSGRVFMVRGRVRLARNAQCKNLSQSERRKRGCPNVLMEHWQEKFEALEDFAAQMILVFVSQFHYAFQFFVQTSQEEEYIAWAKRMLFQVGDRWGWGSGEAGAGHLQMNRRSFFLLQQGRCLGSAWHSLAWMIYLMICHVRQQLFFGLAALNSALSLPEAEPLQWFHCHSEDFCACLSASIKWQNWCFTGSPARQGTWSGWSMGPAPSKCMGSCCSFQTLIFGTSDERIRCVPWWMTSCGARVVGFVPWRWIALQEYISCFCRFDVRTVGRTCVLSLLCFLLGSFENNL